MVLVVVGAAVLGLVVVAAVLFGVILPRFQPGPESGPTFAPGELTPEESTITAVPQPDGTVRVEQVLIFDIVPGLEDRPVTWYLDGTQIGWKSSEREAQYGVIPTVVALSAREVPVTDAPVELKITVDDSDYDDPFFDGRRYALIAPGPWSPGRHRIEFSYVLGDVWVEADGDPPAGAAAAVRQRSRQRPAAGSRPAPGPRGGGRCSARRPTSTSANAGAAATATAWSTTPTTRPGEAVAVTEPSGVTAAPIPVTEKTR